MPFIHKSTPQQRARFLCAIADELDALGEAFFVLAEQETALPLARLQGERARTSGQLRMFAGVIQRGDTFAARIDTALADRQPLPRPDLRQYQQALGPVAVFGASNFPLAFSTAGGDTASALAAGCPVVVKAHPGHMATAELTAEAIVRAVARCGLPGGVFNMIFGTDIGAELVRHPAIQAVGFTGSLAGGKALYQMAQQRSQPIPLFAEMSAINPLIILPQALQTRAEALANELVASFTLGGGQFCTRPGLILALRGAGLERFKSALCAAVAGSAPQVLLNAPTLQHYRQGVAALAAHPRIERLASGLAAGAGQAQTQLWQAQVEDLLAQDTLLQTEVFGPAIVAGGGGRCGPATGGGESAAGTAHRDAARGSGRRPRWRRTCCRCCARRPDGCCLTVIPPAWKCAMRWSTAARGRRRPMRAERRSAAGRLSVFCARSACRMRRPPCYRRRCRMRTL